MLKDRGEPVAPLRCGLKYAPGGWDCAANKSNKEKGWTDISDVYIP